MSTVPSVTIRSQESRRAGSGPGAFVIGDCARSCGITVASVSAKPIMSPPALLIKSRLETESIGLYLPFQLSRTANRSQDLYVTPAPADQTFQRRLDLCIAG